MTAKELPPPDLLRKLLRYEPVTGKLYWLKRTPDMFSDGKQSAKHKCNKWNAQHAGDEAFRNITSCGYRKGKILDNYYAAHRVIWEMTHGNVKNIEIDHINNDKSDNRIENLRCATRSQNMWNVPSVKTNTSGFKNVTKAWNEKRWRVKFCVNGKFVHIGYFDTPEEAHAAYCKAADQYHKEFANTGIAT